MPTLPLSRYRHHLIDQCKGADHLVLALDFDGTLAPLHRDPQRPRLNAAQRRLLTALGRARGVTLALVSGRSVDDLMPRVGVAGIYYIGNHGLEMRQGKEWIHRAPQRLRLIIAQAERAVAVAWSNVPGILIENKGPVLTVHYRQVPQSQWPPIKRELVRVLRQCSRGKGLTIGSGKAVVELRPKTDRHKGWAVQQLMHRVRRRYRCAPFVIAVGDDRTDEDMFRTLRGVADAATIHVGRHATAAQYRTRAVRDVWRILQEVSKACASR